MGSHYSLLPLGPELRLTQTCPTIFGLQILANQNVLKVQLRRLHLELYFVLSAPTLPSQLHLSAKSLYRFLLRQTKNLDNSDLVKHIFVSDTCENVLYVALEKPEMKYKVEESSRVTFNIY